MHSQSDLHHNRIAVMVCSILLIVLSSFSAQASGSACSTAFDVQTLSTSNLPEALSGSGRFVLFKSGGYLQEDLRLGQVRGSETNIDSQTLSVGRSYVVIVTSDRVYIGDNYFNHRGTTALTHTMLEGDIREYRKTHGLAEDLIPNAGFSGGAIRINLDGSIDVSGYHKKMESGRIARVIAQRIKTASPSTTVRWTPSRFVDAAEFETTELRP